jgi:hypothetical protein
MCAPAAAPNSGRSQGIVACFAPTARCHARQCRLNLRLAVARRDHNSNLSRLAREHVEQSNCMVASSRGVASRPARSGASSCNHLDCDPRLDGRRLHCEQLALWSHALPLHRPVLSGDDCAGYCSCRHFVGYLPMDCVGRRCRRREQIDLVGDRASVGEILIADAMSGYGAKRRFVASQRYVGSRG